MDPAISVIIPSYNNERYMKECLDSVLCQSFENFEIVICDDHSTDGTFDILEHYRRNYKQIKVIRNEQNLGVTPSRHRAIVASRGKYITTLDHDDIYLSRDKLHNEYSLVSHHKEVFHKDVCAFSDIKIIDAHGNVRKSQWDPSQIRQGDIFREIMTRSGMIPRDFLFLREDYFKIGGFDHTLKLYEDWDLKIRLAKIREFNYTGQDGTGYRRVNTGFSYAFTLPEHIEYLRIVFQKNKHLIPRNEIESYRMAFMTFLENKQKTSNPIIIDQAKSNCRQNRFLQACTHLCKIIRDKFFKARDM